MDKIEKFLKSLSSKELSTILPIVERIRSRDWEHLDLKKLSNIKQTYRVRKGTIRIIFTENPDGIEVVDIGRRSDTTYS